MELTWTEKYRISAAIGGMTGMSEELQRQGYSSSARMLVEYAAGLQAILDRHEQSSNGPRSDMAVTIS